MKAKNICAGLLIAALATACQPEPGTPQDPATKGHTTTTAHGDSTRTQGSTPKPLPKPTKPEAFPGISQFPKANPKGLPPNTKPQFQAKTKEIEVELTYRPLNQVPIGTTITLIFIATTTSEEYHMFSARTDGHIAYVPTALVIDSTQSSGFELVGKMTEDRIVKEEYDQTMGGTIRQIDHFKCTFSRQIKVTAPQVNIVASFEGQVCADQGYCKFFKFPLRWSFPAAKG